MTPEEFERYQKAYDEGYRAGAGSGKFCNNNPYLGKPEQLLEMNGWEMGFGYHYKRGEACG